MRNHIKTVLRLGTLSIALLAAGCGGGGDSSSSSSDNTTVQGVAAKGIIKKGRVEAFSVDAQGALSTSAIATGTTNDDGSYSLVIPKTVLNFIVQVSSAPGATMADEATGQDIPVPAGLKMRNVVTLTQASEAVYTGHVSPLTEMAVQTAEKISGGLTPTNIAKAKAGVTVALGFDPEKVKPVNSNSADATNATVEQKLQSLALAALSKLAKDGGLGCPAADFACVVNKAAASATISGDNLVLSTVLTTDVRAAMVAVAADTNINKTGQASVDGTATFTQSTVPATTGAATGLQAAKQLIANLRTTGNALSNSSKTGALDLSAASMQQDFDKAIEPLDEELADWLTIIPQAIDLFESYKAGTTTTSSKTVYGGGYPIGFCGVYSDVDATTLATSKDNAVNVACGTQWRNVESSWNGSTYAKKVGKGIKLTPNGSDYSYTASARISDFGSAGEIRSTRTRIGDIASGTISYNRSGDLINSVTVAGTMPARVDFATGLAITDHELWNLNFARTDQGSNVFKYALSGDLTSIKAGVASGKIAVETGSFALVQEDGNGSVVEAGEKEINLIVSGESGGSKISGSLNLANFMADKNGFEYRPTKVTFKGTLATNSAEFFSGTLTVEDQNYASFDTTQPESSTNFTKGVVALVGKITVPDRPALDVSINATKNTFDTVDVIGQYNDGTTVINASVTHDGSGANTISISSANGTSVTIAAGQESGDVMKDNVKLGVINTHTGIINYVDGSFESLK